MLCIKYVFDQLFICNKQIVVGKPGEDICRLFIAADVFGLFKRKAVKYAHGQKKILRFLT